MKLDSLFQLRKKRRRTLDHVPAFSTVIGAGSTCAGNFSGKDNYAVYGRVEGECDLDGTLMLGQSGHWVGEIVATHVIIAGTVEGNVTAREKLELAPSANIRGNLKSAVIAIAEGAVYDGQIRMEQATRVTRFVERRGTERGEQKD